jgi:hypothetical protein
LCECCWSCGCCCWCGTSARLRCSASGTAAAPNGARVSASSGYCARGATATTGPDEPGGGLVMTRPLAPVPRPLEAPAERKDGGDEFDDADAEDDAGEDEDEDEAAGNLCGADESAMLGAVSFTHRHTTGADAGFAAANGEDDGGDEDDEAEVGSSGVEKLRPNEPPDNEDDDDEAAAE